MRFSAYALPTLFQSAAGRNINENTAVIRCVNPHHVYHYSYSEKAEKNDESRRAASAREPGHDAQSGYSKVVNQREAHHLWENRELGYDSWYPVSSTSRAQKAITYVAEDCDL